MMGTECDGDWISYLRVHLASIILYAVEKYVLLILMTVRPLQINYLFLIPLSSKIDAGGRHIWRVMVVKITSSTRPKIEAVYFCTVLVLMNSHAGGNQGGGGGGEKQLINLEWPYVHFVLYW